MSINIESDIDSENMKVVLNQISSERITFFNNYKSIWDKKSARIYFNSGKKLRSKSCYQIFDLDKNISCENCPLKKAIKNNEKVQKEVTDKKGQIWSVEWYPTKNGDNNQVYMLAHNVTKPRMIEDRLRERSDVFYKVRTKFHKSQEKFKSLFVHNPDGICAVDLNGKLISANPALKKITGYDTDEILNTQFIKYIAKSDKNRVKSYFKRAISGKAQECETIISHREGDEVIASMKIFPMKIEGEIIAIYFIIKNITEKKKFEEKLKERAYYDSLTGLPNKNYVDEKINKIIKDNKKAAIIFLDMDRFKRINDSLGHSTGDRLLREAAKRINKVVFQGIVARYSGDEFIIIFDEIKNRKEVEKKVKQIVNQFSIPFSINSRSIFLSFSMGISIYPEDVTNKTDLIKYAYLAMDKAKNKVEKSYHFFDSDLRKAKKINSKKLNIEGELRKAIKNSDFILNYQPQIDIYNGEITGFEALIRWHHEKLGTISPSDFIPLAEETGLIKDIGKWVLKTACQQLRIWQEKGYRAVRMAINVSIQQLKDPKFIDDVRDIIVDNKLDPSYVELEITENIMRNLAELEIVLNKLKQIGVKISIDDFGTGYSSLSVLQGLPINTLKIDQSFINKSTTDKKSAALVKTIIDMGKNLDLNVIAEGIEKKEQVKLLKENNCRIGQGYLFSKPLPFGEICDMCDFNNCIFTLDKS